MPLAFLSRFLPSAGDLLKVFSSMKNGGDHATRRLSETVLQDMRFSARTLRKQPGFAAIAILTHALSGVSF
jgi:hypothetical protein